MSMFAWVYNDTVFGIGRTPAEAEKDAENWMTTPRLKGSAVPCTSADAVAVEFGHTDATLLGREEATR